MEIIDNISHLLGDDLKRSLKPGAKIKVAADMYPFRFLAVRVKPKKEGGGWAMESFE